ncbi:WD40 repeat domain-containing protein, partial [Arthrospira platensis SPKY2]
MAAPDGVAITALSLAGERLALGYNNGFVEVWSVADSTLLEQIGHPRQIFGVALSPDGGRLAVGLQSDAQAVRYTQQELDELQRRGGGNSSYHYLTPGTNYVERRPGFAV